MSSWPHLYHRHPPINRGTLLYRLQYNVNTEGLGTIPVPVPPLVLQRQFEKQLAVVERMKAVQQTSLRKLDVLFTSLQHSAFLGEL
jgi:type I restriction enzyme S subunit